jgi:uncharacterized membrane protein
VISGILLWAILLGFASVSSGSSSSPVLGLILILVWIGLPIATFYDMKYVRANGKWNPNTVLWVVAMIIWIVNILAGAVYLYRRHESIGAP